MLGFLDITTANVKRQGPPIVQEGLGGALLSQANIWRTASYQAYQGGFLTFKSVTSLYYWIFIASGLT